MDTPETSPSYYDLSFNVSDLPFDHLIHPVEVYRRWKGSWCPCCGGIICAFFKDPDTLVRSAAIVEGVKFCGWCIAWKHHEMKGPDGETLGHWICRMILEGSKS